MIVSFLKNILRHSAIFFILLMLFAQTSFGQWLAGYQFRKEITIADANITGGPHVNFPLLIDLTGDADIIANAESASGFDIAFTDSDGTTLLDHEILTPDRANYQAFVSITLPTTVDKVIYVYYGNSSVSSDPSTTAAWNTNYQAVLHLQESGSGSNDEFKDATSNGYDGTGGGPLGAGDPTQTPIRTTGKFGFAQQFDGTNDRIRLRPLDETNPGPTWTAVSVQAWLNITTAQDAAVFGKTWGSAGNTQTWLLQSTPTAIGTRMQTNTSNNPGFNPYIYSTSSWYHAVVTWDAADNQLRVYINGIEQTPSQTLNGTEIFSAAIPAPGNLPTIGNIPINYGNRAFNGLIQETRVSNTAFSSGWIKTEYDNQNNATGFISKNSEERYPDASLGVVAAENPICEGSSTSIIVSNSETGVNYQLRDDSDDSNIGGPVAGTGGAIYLPTGTLTATTTFNVLATNDAGSASVELTSKPTITINTNPTATLVSDKDGVGNIICEGEAVQFTASGGTTYEFFVNGFGVQGPGISDTYITSALNDGDIVTAEVTDGNGCSATSNAINMTVNLLPDALAVPNSDIICSESSTNIVLSNPNGVGASYTWTVVESGVSGGSNQGTPVAGPIIDVLVTTGPVSGTATYTITPISGDNCIGPSTIADVTVNPKPDDTNGVTVDRTVICVNESVIVTVQSADPGINYEVLDASNNVVSNIESVVGESDLDITTYGLPSSTTLKVRATDASTGCLSILTNTENVSISTINIIADIASTPICEDDPVGINLNSITNDPGIGSVIYSWSGPMGFSSGVADPLAFNSSSPNWPGPGLHTYTLTVTDDGGNGCVFISNVDVEIDEIVTADAGSGGDVCGFNYLFNATPSVGTGTWTQEAGPGTSSFNNANSPNATVTVDAYGSYTYRWTETNGACSDFAEIIVNFYETPVADAGSGGDICGKDAGNPFNLSGTASIGLGTWTQESGPGSSNFVDPNAVTTNVTVDTYGTYVFRWTEVNGICSDFDEVTVTFNENPSIANAGPDIEQCNNSIFTMVADVPAVGTGTWSIISGPGTITNPSSPTTTVTGVTAGDGSVPTILEWAVSNGSCAVNTDQVSLTNYSAPTVSNAGVDQEQCNLGDFTLAGNVPASGNGLWSIIGPANGAVITTPVANNSTVTGLTTGNSVTLRWTISNGVCTDSFDEVILTNSALPDAAVAGADQEQCEASIFIMAATPVVTGTGTWSIVSGPGTVTNPSSPTTTVTGVTAGDGSVPTILEWTVTNSSCPNNTDQVSLTNYSAPTVADAGIDQEQCALGDFTLAGNVPASGNGLWSIIGPPNGAVITTPTDPESTVTGLLEESSVTLRWTISQGVCTDSFDEVVLTNSTSADAAIAGPDQEQCATSTFTMAATPVTVGEGTWSIISGPGTITNPSSPTTTVTGVTEGDGSVPTILEWTVTNSSCPNNTDQVSLTNYTIPSVADAGVDQEQCNLGDFTLAGNIPSSGSGLWSIEGPANGAVITTPTANNSTVTGLTAGNSVTLRWTISNGVCTDSFDEVLLTNNALVDPAVAGSDQEQCETSIFTMAATPVTIGIGTWSIVSGPGTITNPSSPTTTVTGITAGDGSVPTILEWTVTNGNCVPNIDQVSLINYSAPTIADAGTDQGLCSLGDFTLSGNVPVTGSALWSIQGPANGAVITTPNDPASTVTGLIEGASVTLHWTISHGVCPDSFDEVILTNFETPTMSINNVTPEFCEGALTDITLLSTVPNAIMRLVSVDYASGDISGGSLVGGETFTTGQKINEILFTNTNDIETVIYDFEVEANGCGPIGGFSTSVDVKPIPELTLTNHLPLICNDSTTDIELTTLVAGAAIDLISVTPSDMGAVGGYTTPGGPSYVSGDRILDNLTNTSNIQQSIIYTFRISANSCTNPIDKSVAVNINPTPVISVTGNDICSGDVTNILITNDNGVPFTTYDWIVQVPNPNISGASDGSGSTIAQVLINSNTVQESVTYRITPSTIGCPGNYVDYVQTVSPGNTVDAGTDVEACENSGNVSITDASIGGGATTSTWSVISGEGTIIDPNNIIAEYQPGPGEVGTVTLELTASDPSTCPDVVDFVDIDIFPEAIVEAGPDDVICEGENYLLAGASRSGSANSVTWSSSGAGTFTPNPNTLNVTYIPDVSDVGNTIRLYIESNDPMGPCVAVKDSMELTINPAPIVSAGSDKVICEGDSIQLSDASFGGSASSIIWSGGSGYFYPDNTTIDAWYVPDFTEIGTSVILTITTDDGDGTGPCTEVSDQVQITVNKAPEVFAGVDQVVCEGSDVSLNGSLGGGAISGTWSGGLGSFSDNTSLIATYFPDPSEAGTVVTLRLTSNDPAGPCIPVFDEVDITINEAPIVDAGLDDEICIGDTIFLAGSLGGSATLATWSGGIGTFSDINDLNAYYIPDTTERGSQVILTLTTNDPDGSGPCAFVDDRVFETIHALPNPFFTGLPPQIAVNDAPIPLQGFPPGGTFYGDGIATSSSQFNPLLAGIGQKFVFYDYSDLNGCANTYIDSILVNPTPDIDFGIDPAVCENADQIPLVATPQGGTFDGTGVTQIGGGSYIFDPSVAGVGEHMLSYAFTDPITGASDTAFQQVRVLAVPVPDFTIDSFTCVDSLIQFSDASTIDPSGEIDTYIWKFGDGSEDTVQNPQYQYVSAGIYFATLRVFTTPVLSTTCTDITGLVEVRVGGRPDVEMSASNFVLGDITQFIDLTTFPGGLPDDQVNSWNWNFNDGNFGSGPNPTNSYADPGKYTIRLDVQSARGCVGEDSIKIAILDVVTSIPQEGWFDDFEVFGNWVAEPIEDPLNSWQQGQPNGLVINSAVSGQNVWVTNLDSTYNNDERSWLKSPAFDLTGLSKPMVQFDYWSDLKEISDGVTFEYSIDGGVTWYLVGNREDQPNPGVEWYGINWYDFNPIINVFGPNEGTDNTNLVGWSYPSDGWKKASIYLDPIIERHGYDDPVIFRFTMASSSVSIGDNEYHEGFAIDNFVLKNRTRNVLIEQFADFSSETTQWFIRNDIYPFVYETMTYPEPERNTSDVIYLEIHHKANIGSGDKIYFQTTEIGDGRADYYSIQNNIYRRTIADGLIRESEDLIDRNDVLKRALIDPKFDINVVIDEGINNDEREKILVDVELTANEDLVDENMKLYVVVLEDNYSKEPFENILLLRNLGRQMISNDDSVPPTGGMQLQSSWTKGENIIIRINADLVGYSAGNPDEFKVIAFVQNNDGSSSNYQEIYQAAIQDSQNPKEPVDIPTALEDDIAKKDLKHMNIYPQPAQHYATVDFGREIAQDYNWEIIDQRGVTLGRGTVLRGEVGFEINTGLLPNGIHFLLIGDKEGLKIHRKLTIMH